MPEGLLSWLSDYLELVGWSGRIIREDKRSVIPDNLQTILKRLDMDARHWIYLSKILSNPSKIWLVLLFMFARRVKI